MISNNLIIFIKYKNLHEFTWSFHVSKHCMSLPMSLSCTFPLKSAPFGLWRKLFVTSLAKFELTWLWFTWFLMKFIVSLPFTSIIWHSETNSYMLLFNSIKINVELVLTVFAEFVSMSSFSVSLQLTDSNHIFFSFI